MLEGGHDNLDIRKNLARQYMQLEDYEAALEHLGMANQLGGENDPLVLSCSMKQT